MGITVVSLINHEKHVQDVTQFITKLSYNEYLQQEIGKPMIDEDFVSLYLLALNDTDRSVDDQIKIVSATIFVQLALEVHEKVAYPSISLKERQLSVLAGDLYSGIYYRVLADMELIQLITTFAQAIKETNEYKIIFNSSETNTIEEAFNLTKKMEKTVIEHFCRFFTIDKFISLFEEYAYFKKIKAEMNGDQSVHPSIFYKKIQALSNTEFDELCLQQLSASKQTMKQILETNQQFTTEFKNQFIKMLD